MNWEAIGAVGELVGAVAVIATLVYFSFQLRQNTKALRLSSTETVTDQLQNMFSLLASDQTLAEIFSEAANSSDLEDSRRVRYNTFCSNLARVYENAFLQKQENAMVNAHWDGMTRMMIDITAFPSYWENRKHWFSEEFQEYMEQEIISVDAKTGIQIPGASEPR